MTRVAYVGESYIVLTLSYADPAYCAKVIRFVFSKLVQAPHPDIVSIRPTVDSLVIEPRPTLDLNSLLALIEETAGREPPEESRNVLRVPVCYHSEVAPDLALVAQRLNLSEPEVVALHSSITYDVWMLGFMPGFPYMGKLPDALVVPRKDRPSPKIAAGSVAVAEEYTGVYPFDSPGGWHILGRTPLKVTDYTRDPPWLFDYGMKIQFYPITIEEYRQQEHHEKDIR